MVDEDEIVKIRKKDLQGLIDANTKAYNKLDDISTFATDVAEGIKEAFSSLEDVPLDIESFIVEEEDKDAD